jgi:hypothetical protein
MPLGQPWVLVSNHAANASKAAVTFDELQGLFHSLSKTPRMNLVSGICRHKNRHWKRAIREHELREARTASLGAAHVFHTFCIELRYPIHHVIDGEDLIVRKHP